MSDKYKELTNLLDKLCVHPDVAFKALTLGLHYIGETCYGAAASHWNLTRQQFSEILSEHDLRGWYMCEDDKETLYESWQNYPYRYDDELRKLEPKYDHSQDWDRRLQELLDDIKGDKSE